jgi:hypothetical protein
VSANALIATPRPHVWARWPTASSPTGDGGYGSPRARGRPTVESQTTDRHTPRMRGIQYAAASRFNHRCLWNTGSPAFAGDDTGACLHCRAPSPLVREGWGEGFTRVVPMRPPPSLALPHKGGGNERTARPHSDSNFKQRNIVIASQRVGAKRRPMTGSAKQSKAPQSKYGLLRRFAPRNDGGHNLAIPRRVWRPSCT